MHFNSKNEKDFLSLVATYAPNLITINKNIANYFWKHKKELLSKNKSIEREFKNYCFKQNLSQEIKVNVLILDSEYDFLTKNVTNKLLDNLQIKLPFCYFLNLDNKTGNLHNLEIVINDIKITENTQLLPQRLIVNGPYGITVKNYTLGIKFIDLSLKFYINFKKTRKDFIKTIHRKLEWIEKEEPWVGPRGNFECIFCDVREQMYTQEQNLHSKYLLEEPQTLDYISKWIANIITDSISQKYEF